MFSICVTVYHLTNTLQRYGKVFISARLFHYFFMERCIFLLFSSHANLLYIRCEEQLKLVASFMNAGLFYGFLMT